jgi:pimeloyl-ACP methyl ester carboxylesterase
MEERLYRRRGGGLSFLMGGDGDPLLLLHGVPGSATSWQKVGGRLTTRFRVILPDLLGFGASEAGPSAGALEDQATAVRQLLAHLRITDLYLGGHGYGGAVALTLMRLYPELTVRGLVLAATDLFADSRMPWALRLASTPGLRSLAAWAMAGNRLGLRLIYDSATQNKDDVSWKEFRRHLTRESVRQTRRTVGRNLTFTRSGARVFEPLLPQIECPVLIVWGDEDPILSVHEAERLRAILPNAILKLYAYTGHFVPEERPIETAEDIALRFTGDVLRVT